MITIEAEGAVLVVRGRGKDGKRWEKRHQFTPYFYIETKNGEKPDATSIEGVPLKQITAEHPSSVVFMRNRYERTWEADVTYVNRFMIDTYDKVDVSPIRICRFDIETKIQQKGVDVMSTDKPITVICGYDTFLKKKFQFTWHPTKKNENTDEYCLYVCKNEKEMLQKFICFIKKTDPDILTAWFGDTFDFPYLINRINLVGLNSNDLSPLGETTVERNTFKNFIETKIRGRVLLDLKKLYKKKYTSGKESFSLDYIAKYEKLGIGKEKFRGTLDELWENDFDKYLSYNRTDVEIMNRLDEKTGLISYFDNIRRKAKCTFTDVFSNMRVIDFLLLGHCHKNGIVLPTNKKREEEDTFVGGRVVKPKKGVYRNVAVTDLRSLYTTIIISGNMSFETVDGEGMRIKDVNMQRKDGTKYTLDTSFDNKREGIIPSVLKGLLNERIEWKKKMQELKKEGKEDSSEFRNIDGTQYALKELLNSFYGVLGNKFFRLYRKEVAGSITKVARNTNKWMQKVLEENGYKIVYGDTDSVFFGLKSNVIEEQIKEGKKIVEKINQSFKEFSLTMGMDNHIFETEFEKIYKSIFFQEEKKKRYAGWKVWEGAVKDEIEIKGFEARRSNNSALSREFQKKIFKIILQENDKQKVYSLVKNFEEDIRKDKYPPEDLGIPAGLSKNPYLYGRNPGEGVLPHVRAVRNSNKFWNMNIQVSERFKWLPVKKVPLNLPLHDVVAFRDFLPNGYGINYEEIVRVSVESKVEKIFEVLGWSMDEVDGQKRMEEWIV